MKTCLEEHAVVNESLNGSLNGAASKDAVSLKEQLKSLENLQELDLKILMLRNRIAELPAQLRQLEQSYKTTNAQFEKASARCAEIEKILRQASAALELNRDRTDRAAKKLEAVVNTHEFQAVNKEIEQLRKLGVDLEAQKTKVEQELEAAKQAMQGIETERAKYTSEREGLMSRLSEQENGMQGEIQSLEGDRSRFTSVVGRSVLAHYDRVRVRRAGIAIVPAEDGRCKGCNMFLPPQTFNQLFKAQEVHACPNCHRIIFVATTQVTGSAGGAALA